MEQSWRQAKGLFFTLLSAPLFWLVIFFVAPLSIVWLYSFGENQGLVDVAFTGTWSNYGKIFKGLRWLDFSDALYVNLFLKSFWFAGLTTFICLVLGFPVALAITFAPERWKPWLLLMVMLPFWTNLLVRTYALIAVLRTKGFVNMGLESVHNGINSVSGGALGAFDPLPLLNNNFAVVFGLVFVNLPFMILPLYSALDRLDRSLLEASLDLGAGHVRTMFNVVVPMAGAGIASGILITFIPALGSYLTPDMLGGPESQMIANVIESQFKRANNWPFGAALSFILVYLTFIAIALQGVFQARSQARSQGGRA
ncbi:putrescine transport system permease protein potH [Asticcacaulis biprosthecium C19]|uniref:Putrescine transport system permease protein potH n=1 Tax=Asticcacaulis biprosthecium C19 TaxID=715226 RepID=F4QU36_9CAUL|nr:ABC transporter permease [Asticcacaulis biprosthecium]EGF89336.1 putrescine transport system permease protein potH [Asticcacaulis biprosthecium C19]